MKTAAIPEPLAPYAEHSERALAHAQEMIDRGDRIQASEKIWGAVAHKLQETAERRAWGRTNHRGFGNLVLHFRKRTGNPELTMRFDAAEALHTNFYQHVDQPGEAARRRGRLAIPERASPQSASARAADRAGGVT